RRDNADGQISSRILRFFGHSRDGIKADVSEKDYGSPSERSSPSHRLKRMPVALHLRRRNEIEKRADKEQQHDDLHAHHDRVELGGLLDAPHENNGEKSNDAKREQIENDWIAEDVRCVLKKSGNFSGGAKVSRQPIGDVDAERIVHERA